MCLVEVWCLRVQAEVVPTYQQIQVVCTCGGAAAQQPSTEEVVTLPGHNRGFGGEIGCVVVWATVWLPAYSLCVLAKTNSVSITVSIQQMRVK